jgi:hypothetical protein
MGRRRERARRCLRHLRRKNDKEISGILPRRNAKHFGKARKTALLPQPTHQNRMDAILM